MAGTYFQVEEYIRGVVNGRVVVRRPGARIPIELAEALGLVPSTAPAPEGKPKRPRGATPPRPRKRASSTGRK